MTGRWRVAAFSADPSTLRALILQAGQGFYIPVYQRAFTWDVDEINRLFEDLDHGITRAAAGQSPSTFLGSVILVSDRTSVASQDADAVPSTVLHVVDGQQRLTTILTAFGVLARFIAEQMSFLESEIAAGSTKPLDHWLLNMLGERREELLNAVAISTYSGDGVYKMKPRLIRQTHDEWGNNATTAKYHSDIAWFLMAVTEKRAAGEAHLSVAPPPARPHLERVVRVITERISEIAEGESDCEVLNDLTFLTNVGVSDALIASHPDPIVDPLNVLDPNRQAAARLLVLASFLLNGVLVIDVKAPDEDYAFALFEPLNTTGQLLTALETLKPLVVQSEDGIAAYPSSTSAQSFGAVEERFPSSMRADDRAKASAELLTTFALAESGRRLSRTLLDQRQYLRSEFQSLAPPAGAIADSRAFVGRLADTSGFVFDIWHDGAPGFMSTATDLDRLCLQVLRSTNHTVVTAALARYYAAWVQDPTTQRKSEFLNVLQGVTAFWTLWRTSRSTTKGIDDVHRRLAAVGHSDTGLAPLAWRPDGGTTHPLPSSDAVRAALRSILATRGGIGAPADWAAKVVVQPLYETSKTLAKFVLLAAHDDRVSDPSTPGLIRRGVPGAFPCLTPAAWTTHYSVEHIAPQNPLTGDTSYEKALYDQGLIGRLGNLTLMPVDLNTLVGNKPWPFKRDIYSVLSMTDPVQRVAQLTQALNGLADKTKTTLESAEYLPFCEFLPDQQAGTLPASFLVARGQRLAELAAERLWPMIS